MDRVLSEKTHKILRKAQLLIFAATAAWGALAGAMDLGHIGSIVAAVLGAGGVFVTYLVENDSSTYFSTKTIVNKILPDKEPEE